MSKITEQVNIKESWFTPVNDWVVGAEIGGERVKLCMEYGAISTFNALNEQAQKRAIYTAAVNNVLGGPEHSPTYTEEELCKFLKPGYLMELLTEAAGVEGVKFEVTDVVKVIYPFRSPVAMTLNTAPTPCELADMTKTSALNELLYVKVCDGFRSGGSDNAFPDNFFEGLGMWEEVLDDFIERVNRILETLEMDNFYLGLNVGPETDYITITSTSYTKVTIPMLYFELEEGFDAVVDWFEGWRVSGIIGKTVITDDVPGLSYLQSDEFGSQPDESESGGAIHLCRGGVFLDGSESDEHYAFQFTEEAGNAIRDLSPEDQENVSYNLAVIHRESCTVDIVPEDVAELASLEYATAIVSTELPDGVELVHKDRFYLSFTHRSITVPLPESISPNALWSLTDDGVVKDILGRHHGGEVVETTDPTLEEMKEWLGEIKWSIDSRGLLMRYTHSPDLDVRIVLWSCEGGRLRKLMGYSVSQLCCLVDWMLLNREKWESSFDRLSDSALQLNLQDDSGFDLLERVKASMLEFMSPFSE